MIRAACLILALTASAAAADAPKAAALFSAVKAPSSQPPEAIGSYAKGCAAGLVELPESGPTWQAMRLSRHRNYGMPELVDYLEDLSQAVTQAGWPGLYIGDMSQPRGGPLKSGHASHQIGLDADIWMLPPDRLNLTPKEREKISSISVRTEDQKKVNANWTKAHGQVLRLAALDPRVDRVFVAAAIKIELCKSATDADTPWLQKLRPIQGHNDHFHVRLKCPEGNAACQTQKPSVATLSKGGNGCDDTLQYWVTTYLEELKHPPKTPPKKTRGARDYTMADLPRACAAVLSSD